MTPERWRQIEDLYHAAQERTPADRIALLECTDPDIRARVERMLEVDSGGQMLDGPAAGLLADPTRTVIATGTQLGAYRIETILGEGGMGVVYRALDTKLNRPVAVKFLSDDLADAASRRRFQREAQTASSLNHPHILTVHDAGEVDGRQYLVTELVDGGTLRDWARAEKRGWAQIVELLVGVADGLAAAHQAGILHRDIKPANILIAKNGYAKLADFGLAKLAGGSEGEITRTATEQATGPGLAIGTVAYMSPEQAAGKPLDARSDIFSFGVVLYELLAGQRPFAGANDLEVMQTIIHGTPQPLPAEIPAGLRGVVEKALEKDPAHRYQSMRDMVVDLRLLMRPSGETMAPVASACRTITWALIGATVVLLIAGIAAWKFWPRAGSHQIRSLAVLPLRNVSRDPDEQYFADGITDALTTGLAQVSALSVIARTSLMRYEGTQKTTPEIARELHVDAVVEGSVQRSGDRVLITAELVDGSNDRHLWAKSYERDARDAVGLQNEVAETIAREIQVKLTPQEQARLATPRPVNPEAQEAYLRGMYWREKYDPKSFQYIQQAVEKDPSYAAAWAALAEAYGMANDQGFMSAKEASPKERAAATRALELDDKSAEAHLALAGALQYREWKWVEADRELRRAIELNPNLAWAHAVRSEGLTVRGRFEEALAEFRRALQLAPFDLTANYGMTEGLFWARRYDQTIEQGRKASELFPPFFHGIIGQAYEQKGDSQHAISELQEMAKVAKDWPMRPAKLADLAHAYAVFGNKPKASRLLAEMTELSKRRDVSPWGFAIVYTGMGDKDRAFEWLDKAYDEHESGLPWIKADPRMDPLRSDARYKELLLRLGLPE